MDLDHEFEPDLREKLRKNIGKYTILRVLGEGGMGVVYAAYDEALGRKVAVKVLHPSTMENVIYAREHRRAAARLVQEAKVIASLDHPNVIAIYDLGMHEDELYIAMELIEGQSMRQWLEARDRSWKEVIEVMCQAAMGLGAAHKEGLVHRDFKPDNVLIGNDGRVVVADFGIVRIAGPEDINTNGKRCSLTSSMQSAGITKFGDVLGTQKYMAPEQCVGSAVDARADIYSFCVTMFEALYGTVPFPGEHWNENAELIRSGNIEFPSIWRRRRVPRWLHKIVAQGLSWQHSERFSSMDLILAELRRKRNANKMLSIGLVILAASGLLVVYHPHFRAKSKCDDQSNRVGRMFRGIWDPNTKAIVRNAFFKIPQPFISRTWEVVEQSFDKFREEWAHQYKEICIEGERERSKLGDQVLDIRMNCLLEARARLSGTVSAFRGADLSIATNAIRSAQRVPRLEVCKKTKGNTGAKPVPLDAKMASDVARWRFRFANLSSGYFAGQTKRVLERANLLEREVRNMGYIPVWAEMQIFLGDIEQDWWKREQYYMRARVAAHASGYSEIAAVSASKLVFTLGYLHRDVRMGNYFQRWVQAYSRGSQFDERVQIELDYNQAILSSVRYGHHETEKLLRDVCAKRRVLDGDRSIASAKCDVDLAYSLYSQGSCRQAELVALNSMGSVIDVLGFGHPTVNLIYENIIMFSRCAGQFANMLEFIDMYWGNCVELRVYRGFKGRCRDSDAWYTMDALIDLGEYKHAQSMLREWELKFLNSSAKMSGSNTGIWYQLSLGELMLGQNQPLQAWQELSSVLGSGGDKFNRTDTEPGILLVLGRIKMALGDEMGAIELLSQVDFQGEKSNIDDDLMHLKVLLAQSHALEKASNIESAKEVRTQAFSMMSDIVDPDNSNLAPFHKELARIFLLSNELDEAQYHAERALELYVSAMGEHHHMLMSYHLELGKVLLARNYTVEAIEHLQMGIRLFDPREIHPNALAPVHFALARAYAVTGSLHAHARALDLAESALEEYGSWEGDASSEMSQVRQWLRKYRHQYKARGVNN